MFFAADVPPQVPSQGDLNPPARVSTEGATAPLTLPKLPAQVREEVKNEQAKVESKVENPEIKFTCHGKQFCDGQMTAPQVRSAMTATLRTISKLDPELARNLTRDGVQVAFVEEDKMAMSFFSTDNLQISSSQRVNLWMSAIGE